MDQFNTDATRLLYKSLHLSLAASGDVQYRELLLQYRADGAFAQAVQDAAQGLELVILDVSERGLIVAPKNRESRFSLRLADLRQHLNAEQKIALAVAHLAICAVFFPNAEQLEDDAKTPLPATVARCRDTLLVLVNRLANSAQPEDVTESADEIQPGWALLKRLPTVNPKGERAATNSIEGFIKLALKQMQEYGLVRIARESEDDAQTLYTATHRLRIHLRELTMPYLFEMIRSTLAS